MKQKTVGIEDNLLKVRMRIAKACERANRQPEEITIVAVTKNVGASAIRQAFACGIRDFGENRIQEAKDKITELSSFETDIIWHMIGHLQSNKARIAANLFDIIHSIDSIRLAEILNSRCQQKLPILLQVNVSEEATKGGLAIGEVASAVREINKLSNLETSGLMTIAPLTSDPEEVRPVFQELRQLKDSLGLKHLSMGMSDDFEIAIEEGATMVRLGRVIFDEQER